MAICETVGVWTDCTSVLYHRLEDRAISNNNAVDRADDRGCADADVRGMS